MYDLDTAGVERFPRHRGRGETRKRGKEGKRGAEKTTQGSKTQIRTPGLFSLFPFVPFPRSAVLCVFRHRHGLAGLISTDFCAEADRQSIPTVYSYYGQTQIGQLLFTEVLSRLVVDFVGHMVLCN